MCDWSMHILCKYETGLRISGKVPKLFSDEQKVIYLRTVLFPKKSVDKI